MPPSTPPSHAPASSPARRNIQKGRLMTLYTVASLVQKIFYLYEGLIFVWILMSWIPRRPGGLVEDIRGALGMLVEPYLNLFRRFIPPFGGIDFSPIVAIFVLGLIERLILSIIL